MTTRATAVLKRAELSSVKYLSQKFSWIFVSLLMLFILLLFFADGAAIINILVVDNLEFDYEFKLP